MKAMKKQNLINRNFQTIDKKNYISKENVIDNNVIIIKNIQKTFTLLSLTLIFSFFAALLNVIYPINFNFILFLFIFVTLLSLINYFKKKEIRLFFVFIFVGLNGYCTGPIIKYLLKNSNGDYIIMSSLFFTSLIFILISLYAIFVKKEIKYLTLFLYIGIFITFIFLGISIFLNFKILDLLTSMLIIIISSGFLLYNINKLIKEKYIDYIDMTINIYIQIYSIFLNLLDIFKNKD